MVHCQLRGVAGIVSHNKCIEDEDHVDQREREVLRGHRDQNSK